MKQKMCLILILSLGVATAPVHAGFFSSLAHVFSHVPIIGNVVDHYANKKANSRTNDKIKSLYDKALRCSPFENDNGKTVHSLMKMKPGFPDWKKLEKLESTANDAKDVAEQRTKSDKARHCYVGCIVRRKLGYSSAVLVGFLKELKDASDCKASTHFEFGDYDATIAGAKVGKYVDNCRDFCGTQTAKESSGAQLLSSARQYVNQRQSKSSSWLDKILQKLRDQRAGK